MDKRNFVVWMYIESWFFWRRKL